jgi:hypothetical protein
MGRAFCTQPHRQRDKPKPFPSPNSGKTSAIVLEEERNSSNLGGVNGASVAEDAAPFSLDGSVAMPSPVPIPNVRTKFRRAKRASRQQDHHHRRECSGER